MTALAKLEALPVENREPSARIAKEKEGGAAFHKDLEHAKREPAKAAEKPKDKRPREDERDPAAPETQMVPTVDVKREIADVAQAVAFSPVTKVAAQGLDAMIQQTAAAATRQVAQAAADPEMPPPMTPLEQAVHDLIDQIRDTKDDAEPHAEPVSIDALPTAPAVYTPLEDRDVAPAVPVAPVRELDPEATQPVNPSHVHLVIDEAERIVVTVAVRGDNVFAHIRGGDDAAQAAFARNAATLDTAMRARGLQLTDFQASRDGFSDTEHEKQPQRERETKQPKFTLEEKS